MNVNTMEELPRGYILQFKCDEAVPEGWRILGHLTIAVKEKEPCVGK